MTYHSEVSANNSFKPNLLRYGKGMANKACHTFAFTTQVGLTQALGPAMDIIAFRIKHVKCDQVARILTNAAPLSKFL